MAGSLWPSIFETSWIVRPARKAWVVAVWRRSWKRTSRGSPASAYLAFRVREDPARIAPLLRGHALDSLAVGLDEPRLEPRDLWRELAWQKSARGRVLSGAGPVGSHARSCIFIQHHYISCSEHGPTEAKRKPRGQHGRRSMQKPASELRTPLNRARYIIDSLICHQHRGEVTESTWRS
jgi:hypothetical protein